MSENQNVEVTESMQMVLGFIKSMTTMFKTFHEIPEELKGRPTDVYVTTFPKCGTTWMQQICHQIRTGGDEDFEGISDVVIWLRANFLQHVENWVDVADRFSPRVFKTHYNCSDIIKYNGKHIFVARNPSDAFVSYFNFMGVFPLFDIDKVSIRDMYYAQYNSGALHDFNIWSATADWFKHINDPKVLFIFFEDLKKDLSLMVDHISKFMGVELSPEKKKRVMQFCSFEYMKGNHRFVDEAEMRHGRKKMHELNKDFGDEDKPLPDKVRQGSAGSGKQLPKDVTEHIKLTWLLRMKEVTGTDSYEEFHQKYSILNK